MAYHDDLLKQAFDLVEKDYANPTQADLRRAVSSAYYAVFHLLVRETTQHWSRDSSRDALGRMFEHSLMKKASGRISDLKHFPFGGEDPVVVGSLRTVGEFFVELQDRRHVADYDNGKLWWTYSEALREVTTEAESFSAWQSIKHEKIAQDYLVSLPIKPQA